MAINIQAKQDVSYLFSSLTTNSSSSSSSILGSSWLSDYASIKNGSYGKLMKAYFAMDSEDSSETSDTSSKKATETTEESKSYAKLQTTSDALKESADALLEKGEKSVFALKEVTSKDESGVETTTEEYDMEGIYKAVNSFVSNYNSVMEAAASSDDERVNGRVEIMANESMLNYKSLNAIGISLNEDGTLALDKETFMKADVSKVENLFQGAGSYGYKVSSHASLINYAADHAASESSSYTASGNYSTLFSSGNLFESWF